MENQPYDYVKLVGFQAEEKALKQEIIGNSHDFEVVSEVGVSCTHPGEDISDCRLCGKEKTETVETLGHMKWLRMSDPYHA